MNSVEISLKLVLLGVNESQGTSCAVSEKEVTSLNVGASMLWA